MNPEAMWTGFQDVIVTLIGFNFPNCRKFKFTTANLKKSRIYRMVLTTGHTPYLGCEVSLWTELKTLLKYKFLPIDYDQIFQLKFHKLRQWKNNVERLIMRNSLS